MNDSGWNMYVFRDGRKNVPGTHLKSELLRRIEALGSEASEDTAIGALIAAGELECSLADAAAENKAVGQKVTEQLACLAMTGAKIDVRALAATIAEMPTPDVVSISVAEGFAYYALHPLRFREPVEALATGAPVRVIGIRSIGTTLSAAVTALFASLGSAAERITVRPHGHPYDRRLDLTHEQQSWVRNHDGLVVIVDEGPGLSGSSFLAVAEAVEAAGVHPSRIVMLGSRVPQLEQMRAPNATTRWPRFRFLVAKSAPVIPTDAHVDLTSGMWRQVFWDDFDDQPASWTHLEMAKYMTQDRRALYKFHGFGHFGDVIGFRAKAAAEAGFAPPCLGIRHGFGKYEVVSGTRLRVEELNDEIIDRIAEYCTFRVRELHAQPDPSSELEAMARWNWQCEFEGELRGIRLPTERPTIADARMLPHEWMRARDGRILKLDGATHGDDHFFPGPCDIAWDLAGMIVEWNLDDNTTAKFLGAYHQRSGDDARPRIANYVLAYAIFRMGWSKMAARASQGTFDEHLLIRDYQRYRLRAQQAEAARSAAMQRERISVPGLQPLIAT